MLEDYVKTPVTRRRLQSGLYADYATDFAEWLHHRGYKWIEKDLRRLAGLGDWMSTAGFGALDIDAALNACAIQPKDGSRKVRYRNISRNYTDIAKPFMKFLREQGVITPLPLRLSATDRWPLLARFRSWMERHRGLRSTTLKLYLMILRDLLEVLGDDPSSYTAEAIRTFILRRAQPHGAAHAASIVVAVRAFLRFLEATGQCSSGMAQAVPGFASWRLSAVPRFLEPADIERVIEACHGDRRLRDKAVILLLARLGLRASDVMQLKFNDIDWSNGRIAVCGKGRRQEWLPLPQEVGDAIISYAQRGRPPLAAPEVFCTAIAPIHPLRGTSVAYIVASALKRAGIKTPLKGAHVLRHSAATAMLRQGISLAGVGAVLRHRSPETTAHYAKVDFALLSEVAQPWPGVSSC